MISLTAKQLWRQINIRCHQSIIKSAFICVHLCPLLLLIACEPEAQSAETLPTPTPIPTPIVPEKPTYTVQHGTVVNTITFSGRVSPVMEQELFFRTEGFVDQLFAQRGDEVAAGEVLAQLEISELENQLAQAQVALETAELTLAQAEQGRQDALVEAQINLEKIQLQLAQEQAGGDTVTLTSAEIDLQNAQQHLADAEYELQKSRDRDWEPEDERRRYEREVEGAQENLTVAQARYNDAISAGSSSVYARQILEQELALAQLQLEQLERGVDPLLELDVQRAELDVQEIERRVTDAQLTAPFDGRILSLSARPGDRVEPFTVVMVLAQPEQLEITADLSSDQLSEMSIGQAAEIVLRTRPGEAVGGTVRQLPYAFSGGAADTDNDDERVRVAFDNPEALNLEMGELATIVIVLEEKDDALWLPPASLRSFQGRDFVVIQDSDAQRRVDVRLGIESQERVEILEGVEEGQMIVGE